MGEGGNDRHGASVGQTSSLLKDVKDLPALLTAAWMIRTEPEAIALPRLGSTDAG